MVSKYIKKRERIKMKINLKKFMPIIMKISGSMMTLAVVTANFL